MSKIIYNPASIDSTITTAVLVKALNFTAIRTANTHGIMSDPNEIYHWIGVIPSETSIDSLPGDHTSYVVNKPWHKLPKKVKLGSIPSFWLATEAKPEDEKDIPQFDTLMGQLGFYEQSFLGKATAEDWQLLSLYVKEFEEGKQTIPLEEQASVWQFYNAALNVLNGSGDLKPNVDSPAERVKDYLKFLKQVKSRIEKVISIRRIEVQDQETYKAKVPVMNINQEITPWALKLARNSYSAAAAFELCGNFSIYSISCQDQPTMEGISKWLAEPHIRMADSF